MESVKVLGSVDALILNFHNSNYHQLGHPRSTWLSASIDTWNVRLKKNSKWCFFLLGLSLKPHA